MTFNKKNSVDKINIKKSNCLRLKMLCNFVSNRDFRLVTKFLCINKSLYNADFSLSSRIQFQHTHITHRTLYSCVFYTVMKIYMKLTHS